MTGWNISPCHSAKHRCEESRRFFALSERFFPYVQDATSRRNRCPCFLYCTFQYNVLYYIYFDERGLIMSAKSSNIMARVEPEIKEQAESIMEQLGLTASGVINMLYRQIILRRGLPFAVSIPATPTTLEAMTQEEFDAMLAKSLKQAEAGEGVPLHEAFQSLRSELHL